MAQQRIAKAEEIRSLSPETSIETKNKQVSASSSKHKFAFEIPDELQQIIEKEMQQAEKGMIWKEPIAKKAAASSR